jgi:hypothetical protein
LARTCVASKCSSLPQARPARSHSSTTCSSPSPRRSMNARVLLLSSHHRAGGNRYGRAQRSGVGLNQLRVWGLPGASQRPSHALQVGMRYDRTPFPTRRRHSPRAANQLGPTLARVRRPTRRAAAQRCLRAAVPLQPCDEHLLCKVTAPSEHEWLVRSTL